MTRPGRGGDEEAEKGTRAEGGGEAELEKEVRLGEDEGVVEGGRGGRGR